MWFTNREALWSLRDGKWRKYSRADGLLTDHPYVMALAADGSIWLRHRYDAGVERVEVSGDRIVRSTAVVSSDPTSAQVTAFHGFDAYGNFWRCGANGVTVRHGNSWTAFTTEDGLVSNICAGEAFWGDLDGSVWLGTGGGLSHYHPGNNGPLLPLAASPIIARLNLNALDPNGPGGVFVPELQGRATRTVRLSPGHGALDGFDGAEHLHHRAGARHAQT